MSDETQTLTLDEVRVLATGVFERAGMSPADTATMAEIVMMSERDGPRSHGLRMLPYYAESFASGYASATAVPTMTRLARGALKGDGDNGYFQIAAKVAREELITMARENGIAAFTCHNCHHLAGLRFDTEPLAEAGLVAIGVVNSLSMVVPHGGTKPAFGTNPMSFACPRKGQAPIVWDQAASAIALMDVRMAAAEGHELPIPAGLGPDGNPTTDPNAILETRSLLPFGAHKGSAIAMMVEILGAALAGATLAVDNAEREAHGGLNVKGGATLIAIDPARFGNDAFAGYVQRICAEIDGNGDARVPGDGRLTKRARAATNGVHASRALIAQIDALVEK